MHSSEPGRPRVSVIIPAYNCARYLPAALDSVLEQSCPPGEIILVNDGSTDDTDAVVRPYLDRISYIKKPNGGLASARNAGLAAATGELVAIMDADDICHPARLEMQLAVFAQFPETVLCSSDFSAFDQRGPIERSHIAAYYSRVRAVGGKVQALYPEAGTLALDGCPGGETPPRVYRGRVYENLVWGNFVHPPTIMVRREAARRIHGFDENIPNATDYDWLIRISRLGPLAYVDFPLLDYRYSGGQMSSYRNLVQLSLDTVAAMHKVRVEDPAFFAAHRRRLQRRIGGAYLHAADAAFEYQGRRLAARYLWKSLGQGLFNASSVKALLKLCLPKYLLALRSACYPAFLTAIPWVEDLLRFE